MTSLVKRNPVSLVQRTRQLLEAWPAGQNHLQPPLDQLEAAAQQRDRIDKAEIEKESQNDEIGSLWSLFPHPPGKRQMTNGALFSNILGSSWDTTKLNDKDQALLMLIAEVEAEEKEMLDRIGKTSFSKILSSPISCNQGKLRLNQKRLEDKQDFKGNFLQKMAQPRKRETELLLGEVGPGRGLFSNILSRLDSGRQKRKRGQSVKSLFTHILR